MELTIKQALQNGIAAHKEGKVQDAERIYRAILQSQPLHPDANHNLGLLAVSFNKIGLALPFFKTALNVNPKIEQFWFSYIDALIKEKQFDLAKEVLKQAKKQILGGEKLNTFEVHLKSVMQEYELQTDLKKKKLTLSEKRKKLTEEKKKQKKKKYLKNAKPSEVEMNNLIKYYQNQEYEDAERVALIMTEEFPYNEFGWKILGAVYQQKGRYSEALNANQKVVTLSPRDAAGHSNLGAILKVMGRIEEAKESLRQTIALKPDFIEAHYNLGIILQDLGRLDEAEASYKRAILLKPDFTEAHYNLSNTFKKLGKVEEAEASYRKTLMLKPDFTLAQYNLGNMFKELGRLEEAETSYRKTIMLKPDYFEAHNNLGTVLKELRRMEEAEESYRQAIALNPDFALAHINLGRILYNMGCKDFALESIEKANYIDPQSKESRLLLSVINSRKTPEKTESLVGDAAKVDTFKGLTSNPVILNRVVEEELIPYIYGMSSRSLDKAKDARYGSGICSSDFNLFEDSGSIIKKIEEDLTSIMKKATNSEIHIYDSFFNILGAGGGSKPHIHLNEIDRDIGFNLGKQKYSLVYYLSTGDQTSTEPGILKLNDPVENILPCEGMIAIIPASREHYAVYNGKTDRVMIGINFYCI